jgi:hypothetical protein
MKKKQSLCAVTIGIHNFILPMDDGLKLVDIISRAVPAEPTYGYPPAPRWKLKPAERQRAELAVVLPGDIELPDDDAQSPFQSRLLALPVSARRRIS